MPETFCMLMLRQIPGAELIVRNKAARIDFRKPLRGTVRALSSFRTPRWRISAKGTTVVSDIPRD
jgi:hypothetical protein